MSRRVVVLLVLCGVLMAGFSAEAMAAGPPERGQRASEKIPNRYIVVFRDSVGDVRAATRRRERAHGFSAKLRYSRALKGFAAKLSPGQARRLRRDAQVVSVTPDRTVQALEALSTGDSAPTGVRRIEAASSTQVRGASSVNVAVIDTGIDLAHPDVNAVTGTDCVEPGTSAQDDNGHGTHVAGTVAARNDGAGVVGVAPGTRLHAVKVLDSRGSGTWSQIICGIDWVTSTRTDGDPGNDIAVANMSLGGGGEPVEACSSTMKDPLHKAICGSTQAGVVYTVAAGNNGWDYDYPSIPDVPAAYPEVLTVTAASDTDGQPGALGGSCGKWEADDRYASFSNYALRSESFGHTLAAPGACIVSTRLGGGTTAMSGTSMAAPHVAGAVALCIAEAGTSGPCADLAANRPQDFIPNITKTDEAYGFYGDPNRPLSGGQRFGYLSWVGLSAPTLEEDTSAPAAPSEPAESISLSASGFKVKGVQHADLSWSGATTTSVDVYRDGRKVTTTANDGGHVDKIGKKGGGSYVYKLCEAGSTTACSGEVTVAF